jgi:hypothetical protein
LGRYYYSEIATNLKARFRGFKVEVKIDKG